MMKQGVRLETLVTFLLLCLSLSGWHSCRQLLGVLPEQLKEALHTNPVAVHLAVGLLHQAADVVIRHCQLKAPCKQKGHLQAATNGPQMMTSINDERQLPQLDAAGKGWGLHVSGTLALLTV